MTGIVWPKLREEIANAITGKIEPTRTIGGIFDDSIRPFACHFSAIIQARLNGAHPGAISNYERILMRI
jgi:hypothetical protein